MGDRGHGEPTHRRGGAQRVPGCRVKRAGRAVGRGRGRDRQDHPVAGRPGAGARSGISGVGGPVPRTRSPVLAYAPLADLLEGVDADTWADLPDPQRVAVDQVLLREQAADAVTDQRAVAAAFLSVVERLDRRRAGAGGDRRPAMARSVDRARDRLRCPAAVRPGGFVGHRPHRGRRRRRRIMAAIAPPRSHPANHGASVVFWRIARGRDRQAWSADTARGNGANSSPLGRKSLLCHRIGARFA